MGAKLTIEDMTTFLKTVDVKVKQEDGKTIVVTYDVFYSYDGKVHLENSFFTKKDANEYIGFINRSTYYFHKKLEVCPYNIYEDGIVATEDELRELYYKYKK